MKNNIESQLALNNSPLEFNSINFFHIASSLGQIILLILVLSWIAKKISFIKNNKKKSYINIIERTSIGSNESIIVVDVKEVKLILGVTKTKITHLYTLKSQLKDELPNKEENIMLPKKNFHDSFKNLTKIFLKKIIFYRTIPFVFFLLFCPLVYADIPGPIIHNFSNGTQTWSLPIQTLVFLTALTFLPAFLLMMTSFTRIIIVFGLLRNALGTPYAPPNQILLGLSLFLTFFIMSPTFEKVYQEAYLPFSKEKINMDEAILKGSIPLKKFMLNQTRTSDLEVFSKIAHISYYKNKNDIPMRILLPSFITSELKTAFQIGFTIFIPFLIIDLVVASVLMALGMMMVPPSTISLPFKLMLFVLVDGWQLLVTSLSQSFNI
ncbi:flagellar biosynthetic protein FliP [Buchnera aphidicola (Aphis helianthi)]|uniref:Flagellar biosynthetic protein FliP n=1 Tax=Buchnera aphidicola (Aphis helianthi) TaxID=2315802 RepID=A0A4D6XPA5_9GAMM|nr:flagellar type III secretion system pore protein FliP [Buchnera aphidicola]QCI16917.1 flagellar biosynthetic protein FliP [Buchnera aphidicola (Aphis helianthi)]